MKKKVVAVLLAVVMVLGTVAVAAGGTTSITVVPGMNLSVNGEKVVPTNAAGEEIEVFAYKDATYLPLRYLAELLGIKIDYDADTMTAIVEGAPVKEEIPTTGDQEYEADIVIVGAGGAGLMAAYTASQGGAKVVVLEKGPSALSSNFSKCGGPSAAETVVAKEQGVTDTNASIFEHMYKFSNTTVDAKLLWEVWRRAGVAVDNMVDLGIQFRDVNQDTYGVGYLSRHSFASRGNDRVGPIISAVEATGGQFLYNTTGEHIIMEDGKAVGVTATNTETGETVIVKAKAVMTCTGGFQGNPEMIQKYLGVDTLVSLGSNTPTGDGINMVLEAGGQVDRNFGVLGNEFGGSNSKAAGGSFGNTNSNFWLFGGLYVDRDGDRFINEQKVAQFPLAMGGEAVLRQGKVYVIMGSEYYDACTIGDGIWAYLGEPLEDWPIGNGKKALTKAPEQLATAIEEGWAFKADTLAELAEHFGLENLEATVAEYDEICANGVDPVYGKPASMLKPIGEGPYYAFEVEPAAWSTFGGVKTDSYLRAVGLDGEAIPGLYCGGCEVGSYYAVPYYDGPGSCVGLAIGSGVYAGENMLKYIGIENGTYSATEQGFGGEISVRLTVVDGKIVNAIVAGSHETTGIGARAVAQLPAVLEEKGTPDIDGVTGATASSNAIIRAAKAAYAEATGAAVVVGEAKMQPGTYEEQVWAYSNVNKLPVKVTVDETSILSIEVPDSFDRLEEHGETFVIFQTVIDDLIPRILENQSFAVDATSGATVSSNAVKQAVELAVAEALAAGGSDPDSIAVFAKIPAKAEAGVVEEITVDLLTVGLGNAGIMASMKAVEEMQAANGGQPISFLGVEKAAKVGGQSGMAHAIFAVNPEQYKTEHNEGNDYINEEEIYAYWLQFMTGKDGTQRCKPDVVKSYMQNSGRLIDWLAYEHDYILEGPTGSNITEGDHDVTFTGEFNLVKFNCSYEERRVQVWDWQKKMMSQIEAAGGEYKLSTEGYELLTDAEGNVVGAKARDLLTGKEYVIHAKAVIMATGGFGAGDLTKTLYKHDLYPLEGEYKQYGMKQNDGKMIQAALDIGAGTWNANCAPIMIGLASLAGEIHEFPVNPKEGINNRTGRQNTWSANDIPEGFISWTNVMYFDKNGNRNAAEPAITRGANNECVQYYWYGPSLFVLIDDTMVQKIEDEGFPKGTSWRIYTSQGGVPLETPMPETREAMQIAIDMGYVFKGDTIEELAEQCGVSPENLRATYDRYQGFCDKGEDEDFGKDPSLLQKYSETGPYYAVQGFYYPYGSTGGLDVDEETRVLKADHETVINGLYAAGGDSLGVILNNDKNYLSVGGPANGWVYTSGFIAGESAAKYIESLK